MKDTKRPGHRTDREDQLPAAAGDEDAEPEIEVKLPGEEDRSTESPHEALERVDVALRDAEDKYLRALADLDNMRKRLAREKTEWLTWGFEPVIKDFLPIVDNLERALAAAGEAAGQGGEASAVVEGLKEGVELTLRQFREVLERHGVTPTESLGQAFDPKLHEAVARVERDDVPPGTVVTEFQRGYRFRDRLLRAAQVCVSVEPAKAETENERAENL